MKLKKNPYADRLLEFGSFTFDKDAAALKFGNSPKLSVSGFFLERMGFHPKKIVLEIGCSSGRFLSLIAKDNPDTAFIGVDWGYKNIHKAAEKATALGLKNVLFLRFIAEQLPEILCADEIFEVWVFFPDPWAKASQLRKRLIQEKFLMGLAPALKKEAKIFFKTDHPGYFQWVLSLLNQPIPELMDYDSLKLPGKSTKARQYKVRKIESNLPYGSLDFRKTFSQVRNSSNFWAAPVEGTLFSGRQTIFESMFVRDELPIYYAELIKQ